MKETKSAKILFTCACVTAFLIFLPIMVTVGFIITVILEALLHDF